MSTDTLVNIFYELKGAREDELRKLYERIVEEHDDPHTCRIWLVEGNYVGIYSTLVINKKFNYDNNL